MTRRFQHGQMTHNEEKECRTILNVVGTSLRAFEEMEKQVLFLLSITGAFTVIKKTSQLKGSVRLVQTDLGYC